MAARTVKTPAEVLEAITPVVTVAPEPVVTAEPPVTEVQPEVKAPEVPVAEPPPETKTEVAEPGKPFVRFQFNAINKITFPDNSEYLAMPGFHNIEDMALADKLTKYINRPGAKTALFRLTPL
jgi:hypothetical protein